MVGKMAVQCGVPHDSLSSLKSSLVYSASGQWKRCGEGQLAQVLFSLTLGRLCLSGLTMVFRLLGSSGPASASQGTESTGLDHCAWLRFGNSPVWAVQHRRAYRLEGSSVIWIDQQLPSHGILQIGGAEYHFLSSSNIRQAGDCVDSSGLLLVNYCLVQLEVWLKGQDSFRNGRGNKSDWGGEE